MWNDLDYFTKLIPICYSSSIGYKGNLDIKTFFDFLTISDAYLVWNLHEYNQTLNSIRRMTERNAANYRAYSHEEIIKKGQEAHRTLYKAIERYIIEK